MSRPPIVDERLAALVERAASRPMTDAARERQLASLAYGNAKLENDRVSRAQVEDALRRTRPRR